MTVQDYFRGRTLIWTRWVRVFCDAGQPKFRRIPRMGGGMYDSYWGMRGFRVYWLGREFNFSFGEDRKGLYKDRQG